MGRPPLRCGGQCAHARPGTDGPTRLPELFQQNNPTCGIGPSHGVEEVVGDPGGVAVVQVELDQGQHVRGVASHDASQLTNGAYEHAVIGGGERDSYSNEVGAVVHGALVGGVGAAGFATTMGWKRGPPRRSAV